MPIIEKARKWMEKFTGLEPEKQKTPPAMTSATVRKKQGQGLWQADIGDKGPKEVDGKGDNSPARPL